MGCHIMDAAFWALDLGHPLLVRVQSSAVNQETAPKWSILTYEFMARGQMPPVKLVWYDGGQMPPRPAELEKDRKMPDNGQLFIGDEGKILAETYGGSPRLIPEAKMKEFMQSPPEKKLRRVKSHYAEWIEACKGGRPAGANFDYAGPLTEVVLLGNVAIRAGRMIRWSGKQTKVLNCEEANRWLQREYREGWTL
jgi:hypothetical protein